MLWPWIELAFWEIIHVAHTHTQFDALLGAHVDGVPRHDSCGEFPHGIVHPPRLFASWQETMIKQRYHQILVATKTCSCFP